MIKTTCVAWNEFTDTFCFEIRDKSGTLIEEVGFEGEALAFLGEKPLRQCTTQEITVYQIYHKHFKEEPADLINKSVTID